MRTKTLISAIVVVITLSISPLSIAEDSAVGAMAEIVIKLSQFPSDADKEKLAAISASSDSSMAEIAVSTAIAKNEHQEKAADKEKLTAIVADESAPSQLRDVASAVLNLNHKASAEDISKLEMI